MLQLTMLFNYFVNENKIKNPEETLNKNHWMNMVEWDHKDLF